MLLVTQFMLCVILIPMCMFFYRFFSNSGHVLDGRNVVNSS